MLILTLLLLTGCTVTKMDSKNHEEVVDKILNINLYNKIGKGYKYYAPRGVVRVDANTYNDVLKRNDITYYLYVDIVSYYYKNNLNYKIDENAYYSKKLKHGKKAGYVEILNYMCKWYIIMLK